MTDDFGGFKIKFKTPRKIKKERRYKRSLEKEIKEAEERYSKTKHPVHKLVLKDKIRSLNISYKIFYGGDYLK